MAKAVSKRFSHEAFRAVLRQGRLHGCPDGLDEWSATFVTGALALRRTCSARAQVFFHSVEFADEVDDLRGIRILSTGQPVAERLQRELELALQGRVPEHRTLREPDGSQSAWRRAPLQIQPSATAFLTGRFHPGGIRESLCFSAPAYGLRSEAQRPKHQTRTKTLIELGSKDGGAPPSVEHFAKSYLVLFTTVKMLHKVIIEMQAIEPAGSLRIP